MRLLAATLLGFAVCVGLYLHFRGSGPESSTRNEQLAAARGSEGRSQAQAHSREETPARTAPPRRETVAAGAESSEPRFHVFGRVVDEDDRSLEAVRVQLAAYYEWATGHDVPRIPDPYPIHGWEVLTSEDGRFHFQGPPPTNEDHWLTIVPDGFHTSEHISFRQDLPEGRPPIRAGERDLGTFRLATAGVIRCTVRDEQGRPVEDAEVIADGAASLEHGGAGDTAGSYVVAHVRPGLYRVHVRAEGFLDGWKGPVEVRARENVGGVDLVLARAPTISGRVTDDLGNPLADVDLWGWPESSGSGAGGRTAADGSFTIHLPQDEPYALQASLEGYRSVEELYMPGTERIEIVLERRDPTRFVIVDAETGEPIEDFGLRVGPAGVHHGDAPAIAHHAGGIVEVGADPDEDQVEVVAYEHVAKTIPVAHDAHDGRVQTVRLERGARLTGRVVRDGEPVRDASIQLHPVQMGWTAHGRIGSTDDQGRFVCAGLAAGEYMLSVHAPNSPPVLRSVLVDQPLVDIGDVTFGEPASIEGRVVPPDGVARGGLRVVLESWLGDKACVTDANGRFRFGDVAEGTYELGVEPVSGKLLGWNAIEVQLLAGEAKEVELDVREYGLCELTVIVLIDGRPSAGLEVFLTLDESLGQGNMPSPLGTTDEHGRVTGWTQASKKVKIQVQTPSMALVPHPAAELDVTLKPEAEHTLRLELGGLAVRIPEAIISPTRLVAFFRLDPPDGSRSVTAGFFFAAGEVVEGSGRLEEEGRLLAVDHLPPGEFGLHFKIADQDSGEVLFAADRPVTLEPGEQVTLDLP